MIYFVELEVEIDDCDNDDEAWDKVLKVFDNENNRGLQYMREGISGLLGFWRFDEYYC